MKVYTRDELIALLKEQEFNGAHLAVMNRWLDRGDGIAVYQNHDLGHPWLGHVIPVSFGSPRAQLEVADAGDLPDRLPDGLAREVTGGVNWRYTLEGTYRGEPIGLAEAGL